MWDNAEKRYIFDLFWSWIFFYTARGCLKNSVLQLGGHGIEKLKNIKCAPNLHDISFDPDSQAHGKTSNQILRLRKSSQSPRFFQPLESAGDARQRGLRRHLDLTSSYTALYFMGGHSWIYSLEFVFVYIPQLIYIYIFPCWNGYMETKGEKQGKSAHSFFHLMKKMLSINFLAINLIIRNF